MDLDERFGPTSPPIRAVEPHERTYSPISRMEVTSESAPLIADYLTTRPKLQLTSIFARTFHVLWLMDREARILIGIEELIDGNGTPIGALPNTAAARPATVRKLGHPSLLMDGGTEARIGGEILFDPDWEPGFDWVLTNKSGRYGLRPWQMERHLVAVHGLLKEKGLYLAYRFLKPVA